MTPHAPTAAPAPELGETCAPAVQLAFPPPPGRCKCGLRLSAANHDGVCDACTDNPLDAPRRPYITARPAKRKGNYRRPLNLPCACCGKAPRHNGGSYCQRCGSDYQADRQQERRATAPNTAASAGRGAG